MLIADGQSLPVPPPGFEPSTIETQHQSQLLNETHKIDALLFAVLNNSLI